MGDRVVGAGGGRAKKPVSHFYCFDFFLRTRLTANHRNTKQKTRNKNEKSEQSLKHPVTIQTGEVHKFQDCYFIHVQIIHSFTELVYCRSACSQRTTAILTSLSVVQWTDQRQHGGDVTLKIYMLYNRGWKRVSAETPPDWLGSDSLLKNGKVGKWRGMCFFICNLKMMLNWIWFPDK